jgi:hypothetical protein
LRFPLDPLTNFCAVRCKLKNKHQLQSISDQLSSLELPEPSVITKLQLQEQDQKVIGNRDVKLSSMEMSDPEGESFQQKKKNISMPYALSLFYYYY